MRGACSERSASRRRDYRCVSGESVEVVSARSRARVCKSVSNLVEEAVKPAGAAVCDVDWWIGRPEPVQRRSVHAREIEYGKVERVMYILIGIPTAR